jgi:hypothetical protein
MKYSDYIQKYEKYNAGEHHLVAIFLIPLLKEVLGKLPVYVNPDGMKSIQGDLVYLCEKNNFSIEVKLDKLRLTRVQYSEDYNPDILLYFNKNKLGVADWKPFQEEYIKKMEDLIRTEDRKYTKYGPTINANEMKSITFGTQDRILPILIKRYEEKALTRPSTMTGR